MRAAKAPRAAWEGQKLLVIHPDRIESGGIERLGSVLKPGDLLVLNDAATFPASLRARTARGEPLELRFLPQEPGSRAWKAVAFGEGDWRVRTEDRAPPPPLETGLELLLDGGLRARVAEISPRSLRLISLEASGGDAALWSTLYRFGHPVQYSHMQRALELWDVQTAYASRPWAAEMPSAGRPLRETLLRALQGRGVGLAPVTHSTGLSATGDPALDRALPFPEFYEIPGATAAAIEAARARGGRVIAVGTSVARAIEGGIAERGRLEPGPGRTALRIDRDFKLRAFDGILSGIHEAGESHFGLLEAFAPREALDRALALAERGGYLSHEFGDSCLVLRR